MAHRDPYIELAGFRRLEDVERRIWYAPTAIVLSVVGLVGAAVAFWSLSRGFFAAPRYLTAGYVVVLGAYGALFAYYHWYRFRRVLCPGCGQCMQPYLADSAEIPGFRFLGARQIDGRFYRAPFDENDRRPWVRL